MAINVAFGVASGSLFGAGRAHAQNAQAERLFEEGNKLIEEGQLAQACSAFEASNRIETRAGTLTRLGECREQNQQLASAWSAFKDASNLASDPRKHRFATTRAAAVEPRLSYLTIAVSDPSRIGGLVIVRNGASFDPTLWNRPLPVDGGDYVVTARAPGCETWQKTIHVPVEGAKLRVDVPALAKASKATTSGVASPPTPSSPPVTPSTASGPPAGSQGPPVVIVPVTTVVQQALHVDLVEPARKTSAATETVPAPSMRKYVAIGTGVAGAAAVGIGLGFGEKAVSTYNDARAQCMSRACDPVYYERSKQLVHDASSDATASTALVAVGGAALVASVIVFLTAPKEHEQATAQIVPTIHDRSTGLAVIGRF